MELEDNEKPHSFKAPLIKHYNERQPMKEFEVYVQQS